jgi:hypothetical protein
VRSGSRHATPIGRPASAARLSTAIAAAFVSDPAGDTLLGRAEQAFADGYEMSDAGVGRGIIRDLLRLAREAARG